MKKYNYILLDWDGCLAKTLDIILQAYKTTFASYNIHPTTEEIVMKAFGDWKGPLKFGISKNDLDKFNEQYMDLTNTNYPNAALSDGVDETLRKLKENGKILALVSSFPRNTITPAIMKYNLQELFSLTLFAEDVTKHKPDPEIIDKALEILKGVKEEAIIIGDSKSDLGTAQNTKIDSILYYPKHNEVFYDLKILKSYNPTYIISDFRKILDII